MAQSGHADRARQRPLSGVKRTLQFQRGMSAVDPSETSAAKFAVMHNTALDVLA
jgi:hypothetical protein